MATNLRVILASTLLLSIFISALTPTVASAVRALIFALSFLFAYLHFLRTPKDAAHWFFLSTYLLLACFLLVAERYHFSMGLILLAAMFVFSSKHSNMPNPQQKLGNQYVVNILFICALCFALLTMGFSDEGRLYALGSKDPNISAFGLLSLFLMATVLRSSYQWIFLLLIVLTQSRAGILALVVYYLLLNSNVSMSKVIVVYSAALLAPLIISIFYEPIERLLGFLESLIGDYRIFELYDLEEHGRFQSVLRAIVGLEWSEWLIGINREHYYERSMQLTSSTIVHNGYVELLMRQGLIWFFLSQAIIFKTLLVAKQYRAQLLAYLVFSAFLHTTLSHAAFWLFTALIPVLQYRVSDRCSLVSPKAKKGLRGNIPIFSGAQK